jgi:hypothetical protein
MATGERATPKRKIAPNVASSRVDVPSPTMVHTPLMWSCTIGVVTKLALVLPSGEPAT